MQFFTIQGNNLHSLYFLTPLNISPTTINLNNQLNHIHPLLKMTQYKGKKKCNFL